jgi:hypothetical protein
MQTPAVHTTAGQGPSGSQGPSRPVPGRVLENPTATGSPQPDPASHLPGGFVDADRLTL